MALLKANLCKLMQFDDVRAAVGFPKMLAGLFFFFALLLIQSLPHRKQKGLVFQHCESVR